MGTGTVRPAVKPGTTVRSRFAGRTITCTVQDGDWTCKSCGVPANRAAREACFVCNAARPKNSRGKKGKKKPEKKVNAVTMHVTNGSGGSVGGSGTTDAAVTGTPTVPMSPAQAMLSQMVAKAPRPPPKSFAAKAAALAEAEEATAKEVEVALRKQRLIIEQAANAAGGTAATNPAPTAAVEGQQAQHGTDTTSTATTTTTPPTAGSAGATGTVQAAAVTTELLEVYEHMARIEPSTRPLMEALAAQRKAAVGAKGGTTTTTATAPTAGEGAASKANGRDARTPARKYADAVTKLGQSKAALASYEALVVKKVAEAAERRKEVYAAAQAFIDAAIADRDNAMASLDEAAAGWEVENTAKLAELRKKVADAEAGERAASAELEAAGDKANEPPPPPQEQRDDADEETYDDTDLDDMSSVIGDGDNAQRYDISEPQPTVAEFREPPKFSGQLDDAGAAKLAAARRMLEHWVQQPVRIPLAPANLGLTADEVKALVGDEAWAESVPAGVILADSEQLPGAVPGILFTALLRLNLGAAPSPASEEGGGDCFRTTLRKAAVLAASTRTTLKTVRRQGKKGTARAT